MLAVAITPLQLRKFCTKRSDLGDCVWGGGGGVGFYGLILDASLINHMSGCSGLTVGLAALTWVSTASILGLFQRCRCHPSGRGCLATL